MADPGVLFQGRDLGVGDHRAADVGHRAQQGRIHDLCMEKAWNQAKNDTHRRKKNNGTLE